MHPGLGCPSMLSETPANESASWSILEKSESKLTGSLASLVSASTAEPLALTGLGWFLYIGFSRGSIWNISESAGSFDYLLTLREVLRRKEVKGKGP